jgi:hypothetical protein
MSFQELMHKDAAVKTRRSPATPHDIGRPAVAERVADQRHRIVPPASQSNPCRAGVRAAVTLPWSQGPIEGHINRLKRLKRQMYGRARLDLLAQRFLLAA